MISAQNLLQQLNGNKILSLVLLVALLIASSCDPLKKAKNGNKTNSGELGEIEGKTRYNPETGKYEVITEVTEKMDTIVWTDDTSGRPPITKDVEADTKVATQVDSDESFKLSTYNVAVLLPFKADNMYGIDGGIPSASELALNYYGGMRIAFEKLETEDIRLQVTVLDTKGSEEHTKSLLERSDLINANLIIGPVKKKALAETHKFSAKYKIPLVSPIYPGSGSTKPNPYFVQVNPSLSDHCYAITKHALDHNKAENIVLVVRDKSSEKKRTRYFHEANYTIAGGGTTKFKEFIVNDMTVDYNDMDPLPYIIQGEKTVFILPSWSDENFIYNFMRKVNLAKGPNEVVVYGMPQWLKYERIDYDYFERLNVHISSASFVNKNRMEAQAFKKNFFNKYGTLPTDEAYMGYDAMLYFGRQLRENGTKFQLDMPDKKLITTSYKFSAKLNEASTGKTKVSRFSRFVNNHVNILEFKNYEFKLAD